MEEKSPTVMTFYNDLADEVDQHFARALHPANTNVHCREETAVHESGQRLNSPSPSSSPTTLISQDLPHTNLPVTTLMLSTQQVISQYSPTQAQSWLTQPPQHLDQPYHTTTPTYLPPSIINNFSSNNNNNSRGAIIYPEFVNHLVHPDVDSFKDIPKLPGQSDPLPTSFSPYGRLPQEDTPQSPSSHSLLHSPLQSNSPVDLSEDDLQQILELNKDTMYT